MQKGLTDEIRSLLNAVPNADEDRMLRRFLHLVAATIRTNHWVKGADGQRKPYLSFKLVSAQVPELPEPRPLYEVFVFSPRFERSFARGTVPRGRLPGPIARRISAPRCLGR